MRMSRSEHCSIPPNRRPIIADARPARTLVLVDIENLVGRSHVAPAETRYLARLARNIVLPQPSHTIVASSRFNAPNVVFDWPNARFVLGRGPKAADLALISIIENEQLASRYDRVIIGSGDGIFAESVAQLAAQGVRVTALVGRGRLSTKLRLACTDLIVLAPAQALPEMSVGA